jgi:hypothetical protein
MGAPSPPRVVSAAGWRCRSLTAPTHDRAPVTPTRGLRSEEATTETALSREAGDASRSDIDVACAFFRGDDGQGRTVLGAKLVRKLIP